MVHTSIHMEMEQRMDCIISKIFLWSISHLCRQLVWIPLLVQAGFYKSCIETLLQLVLHKQKQYSQVHRKFLECIVRLM